MIFKGLKHTVLKNKFDTLLAQTEGCRTVPLHKIQSVGIITLEEISSKIDLQKEVGAMLGVRNVKIYSLRKFSKTDEFSYKHFTEKDINWKGKFTQTSFQIFLEEPLDLIIGYFTTKNIFLETAVLQSKAQFKVGFSGINPHLYEIEISEKTENILAFTSELKRYLKIINKL
mgnify:FL=1|tara:strand:+ start:8482 stop:8997 length:516 start_codon:yes stop_codon:yes gene_type:complete